MTTLLLINTIIFCFFAIVWNRKNLTNVVIKSMLIVLTVTNCLFFFEGSGIVTIAPSEQISVIKQGN